VLIIKAIQLGLGTLTAKAKSVHPLYFVCGFQHFDYALIIINDQRKIL